METAKIYRNLVKYALYVGFHLGDNASAIWRLIYKIYELQGETDFKSVQKLNCLYKEATSKYLHDEDDPLTNINPDCDMEMEVSMNYIESGNNCENFQVGLQ